MGTLYRNCERCGETFTSRHKTTVFCRKCNKRRADEAWKERMKPQEKQKPRVIKRKYAEALCTHCGTITKIEEWGDYGNGLKGKCVKCKGIQSMPGYEKEKTHPVNLWH